jgi:hypothetical protein
MSNISSAAKCGRSTARSATLRAPYSEASRAASLSVKVLWSRCGASSRTVSRCAVVMVSTRSASDAILDVSCRAAWLDASPPSFSRTSAASGCIGCPTSARVPALDAFKSGSWCRAPYAAASRSAMGERQMFPVQTNNTCRAVSSVQLWISSRQPGERANVEQRPVSVCYVASRHAGELSWKDG